MRLLHIHDRTDMRGGADFYLSHLLKAVEGTHGLVTGRSDTGEKLPTVSHWVHPGVDALEDVPVSLKPILDAFRPDLIHFHNVMNPSVLAIRAGVPALATLHDHRTFCPGMGKINSKGDPCEARMERSLCRDCIERPSHFEKVFRLTVERARMLRRYPVTVVSEYMATACSQMDFNVVRVIPPVAPPVQPAAPPPHHGKTLASASLPPVLFVGRLTRHKGIWNAVKIWRLSGIPNPLIFVGTGSERSRLEQEGFHVTGWQSTRRVRQWLGQGLAVLFPPHWQEPYGMVGPEALSAGTPVVAWDTGGIGDWCPTSMLFQRGAWMKMAQRLQHLAQAPPTQKPIQLQSVEHFKRQWTGLYHSLLNSPKFP